MLPDDEGVVLSGRAAEEFEGHDEKNDADAGSCHHTAGSDVPLFGEEAWWEL